MRCSTMLAASAVLSLVGAMCQAFPDPGGLYILRDGSTYQQGCFEPCECPIMQEQPLLGRFRLVFLSSDPLFDHYAVSDIDWSVPTLGRIVTGSGLYRIGGEAAITQQLTLDLQISGGPVTHFDSGVVGGADFPNIDIAVSMHGMYCYDVVFSILSSPCRCDWDQNGSVTPADVAAFVSSWSLSLSQGTYEADFDGNGVVTIADLASFVSGWFEAAAGGC